MATMKSKRGENHFTAQVAVANALGELDRRREDDDPGLPLGIPELDFVMKPLRRELITVIGLTSNYKTGFMSFLARNMVRTLRERGNTKKVIIWAGWETSLEEQVIVDLANITNMDASNIFSGDVSDMQRESLTKAGIGIAASPLIYIGHSMRVATRKPRLTMSAVIEEILAIRDDYNLEIACIFADYLQLVPPEREGQEKRISLEATVETCKDLVKIARCPVILGCQAKQELMKLDWKLPEKYDGAETSAIATSSDRQIGLWFPKNTEPPGSTIQNGKNGTKYTVTNDLLLVNVAKQRFGIAPYPVALKVDPATNSITTRFPGSDKPRDIIL